MTGRHADDRFIGDSESQAVCWRAPRFMQGPRVALPCQLVDDLSFGAWVAPQNSLSFQGTADLVHGLPRCDACALGELIVVEGPGSLAEQLDDVVTMAWRTHTEKDPLPHRRHTRFNLARRLKHLA